MNTERKPTLAKAEATQVETVSAKRELQSIAKYPAKVIANMTHAGVTYAPGDAVVFASEEDRTYHENAKSVEIAD